MTLLSYSIMSLTSIKYISYGDTTGYGLSGLAYLRGLLNLGFSVYWRPVFWGSHGLQFWSPEMGANVLEAVRASQGDPSLRDLQAIMQLTTAPKDYDIVISHIVPEYLPSCFEEGKTNFAYCAWESDTIPAHWPAILNKFHAVLVPSQFNADVFRAGGVTVPIHVVPHIRRHAHEDITPEQRSDMRRQLGIDEDRFVFYSIGAWMLRKDFPRLIEAFLQEFGEDEPVALLLKTSSKPVHFPLPHEQGKTSLQLVQESIQAFASKHQRSRATIALLAGDGVSGAWLDCLHQVGDAYISLSRAEGWGMGAFEATVLGRPVLMTGWSGQLDFLGHDHPGLIDYSLEPIDWPGTSYGPDHRWAVADIDDTRRKMRELFERRNQPDEHAMRLSEKMCSQYSEAVIMRQYRAIIGA
ncbi:glycosyltransferase family 1 protein [Noviherbaspirillum cavernae]|uniref:Glycosyltransferase family 1 protein n=2 Tax=Noviherbaspirillum cavernae TaxID=2320862 RepID=A0A418WYQ4_9BURK|nr:glycosyltransferase family 1 protein [Noviherbaspirillum cavernae]